MKELIVGCALLLALLLLGLGAQYATDLLHEPVSVALEQAGEAARQGDWDAALTLSRQARQRWRKNWQLLAAMVDHEPMEVIDDLFACLEDYAGDRRAFAACCTRLSVQTRSLGDFHGISWWHIL